MTVLPTTRGRRFRRDRALVVALLTGALVLSGAVAPAAAAAAEYRDCSQLEPAPGAQLHRCDLPDLVIIGLDLQAIDLAWSNLPRLVAGCDPDEPRTNLSGARLARTILTDALLCDAILDDVRAHHSDMTGVALEDATLRRADLGWVILDGADASFADLSGARLARAVWRDGAAVGANLTGIRAHASDWRGTNLRAAHLSGADLRHAVLTDVDLTDAILTGADLRGATGLDTVTWSNTTCPDGTNSDDHGGTCVGH